MSLAAIALFLWNYIMTMKREDAINSIVEENQKLRALLEEQRQREMSDLRQRLSESEAKMEHYRAEAQRNADIGKQLAAEYERKLTELKAKVEAYERTSGRPSR